jgi:prevent-host-death family protein
MDIAQKELPNLIEDVVLGGRVVITRNSKPVAELIPMPHERPRPVFGSAKGQVVIMDNFDEPLEEFLVS